MCVFFLSVCLSVGILVLLYHRCLKWFLLPIFVVGSVAVVFAAAPIYLKPPTVTRRAHHWHFRFKTSAWAHYKLFALHHPERLVLDIKGARLSKPIPRSRYVETPVVNIRAAQRGGNLRLVFDLEYPVRAKISRVRLKSVRAIDIDLKGKYPALVGVWQSMSQEAHGGHRFSHAQAKSKSKLLSATDSQSRPGARWHSEPKAFTHPVSTRKPLIIVIDPGHGGKDPGATGRVGAREKNVVLSISRYLAAAINREPGFKAVLTRTSDRFISLRGRLAIARRYHADMFLAVHADAYRNHEARGVSVFALSQRGATSEAARWLATRENASELMGGVALSDKSHLLKSVLLNLSQTATIRASLQIGQELLESVRPIARLHHSKVEQAAFVVLKSPDIPSLLVETGFLSNREEERRLSSPAYRRRLAMSLEAGIRRYFVSHPPRGSWLAWQRGRRYAEHI